MAQQRAVHVRKSYGPRMDVEVAIGGGRDHVEVVMKRGCQ